jgi:hypothetical protein
MLRARDRYNSSNNASLAGWTVGEGVGEGTSGVPVQLAVRAKTTTRASRFIGDNPRVLCRASSFPTTPTGERTLLPHDSSPAVDRRREVRLAWQLVGALFAHAEDLGDLNNSKEPCERDGPNGWFGRPIQGTTQVAKWKAA